MGDILIIGGGFAGLTAARVLSAARNALGHRRILLVDAKKTFDFLPLLPDVAGGRLKPERAHMSLPDYLARLRVNFVEKEVARLDAETREAFMADGSVLGYEFLVLAPGSRTNFFGMQDVARNSLKLDHVEDARRIGQAVLAQPQKNIFVIGGGYTGIEVATHVAILLRRRGVRSYRLHVVEKADDILSSLPVWMQDYARLELCRLKIQTHTNSSVTAFSEDELKLSDGRVFEHPLVIWAAGVTMPAFVQEMPFDKDKQGRLVVDEALQFHPGCFAVGDVVSFPHKGRPLRMAVMFSVAEATVAAKNILRLTSGNRDLKPFKPLDLGYIVPLAHKKSCGRVFFGRIWGIVGWLGHYLMCVGRAPGWRMRLDILWSVVWPR